MCTGNICRSPIAERLARAYATERQLPNFISTSAGTRAVASHPIHDQAALVLRELGGDSAGFSARQLTARIATNADLVLTMTRTHRDAVLELAPRQLKKTFTLNEASQLIRAYGPQKLEELSDLRPLLRNHQTMDIPDPVGHGPDVFASVGAEIAELLPPVLDLCR